MRSHLCKIPKQQTSNRISDSGLPADHSRLGRIFGIQFFSVCFPKKLLQLNTTAYSAQVQKSQTCEILSFYAFRTRTQFLLDPNESCGPVKEVKRSFPFLLLAKRISTCDVLQPRSSIASLAYAECKQIAFQNVVLFVVQSKCVRFSD